MYKWSIKNPQCGASVSSNPRTGPLLTKEQHMNTYLEYVREFVTDVLGDDNLITSFKMHATAIQEYAEVDDWNWWGDLSIEQQNDPNNWSF